MANLGMVLMRGRRKKLLSGLNKLITYVEIKDAVMVEIGCYQGESTELFCKSNKITKVYTVDPWEVGYDPDEKVSFSDFKAVEKAFDSRVSPYNKVIKIKKRSQDAIHEFNDESLDLVYIDGDHRYDYVVEDIRSWTPKLKKGGYLSGHDYGVDDVHKAILNGVGKEPDKIFRDGSWIFRVL